MVKTTDFFDYLVPVIFFKKGPYCRNICLGRHQEKSFEYPEAYNFNTNTRHTLLLVSVLCNQQSVICCYQIKIYLR